MQPPRRVRKPPRRVRGGALEAPRRLRGGWLIRQIMTSPRGVRCGSLSIVPGEGSTFCNHLEGARLPRPLPFGS